jgi:hypothetical protein
LLTKEVVIKDGGGFHFQENGNITIGGGGKLTLQSSSSTGRRVELSDANITFFNTFGGVSYPHKSLEKIVTGITDNGVSTEINGRFVSPPKVFIFPRKMKTYDAAYNTYDQEIICETSEVTSLSNGRYSFVPEAKLVIVAQEEVRLPDLDLYVGPANFDYNISSSFSFNINVHKMFITFRVRAFELRNIGSSLYYYTSFMPLIDGVLEIRPFRSIPTTPPKVRSITLNQEMPIFDSPVEEPSSDYIGCDEGVDVPWITVTEEVSIDWEGKEFSISLLNNCSDVDTYEVIIDKVMGRTRDGEQILASGSVFYIAME